MSIPFISRVRQIGPRGGLLLALLMTIANAAAQTALLASQAQETAAPAAPEKVSLTAGRSVVVPTSFNITRIAITNAEIADAVVVSAA